jgi:ArsR family transcriptional regulator
VSKHLAILDGAGLVDSRKEGRWMYYRLPEEAAGELTRPVLGWLREVLTHDSGTKADAARLKRVLACDPETICRRQRRRSQES